MTVIPLKTVIRQAERPVNREFKLIYVYITESFYTTEYLGTFALRRLASTVLGKIL